MQSSQPSVSATPSATRAKALPPEALRQIAAYFQVLSEPARLQLLDCLRESEHTVGELAERLNSSAANTSRHLTQLAQGGLVRRESRGNCAYYSIADPAVYQLCELVCSSLALQFERGSAERAAVLEVTAAHQPKASRAAARTRKSS